VTRLSQRALLIALLCSSGCRDEPTFDTISPVAPTALPLRVVADRGVPHSSLKEALGAWNRAAGCKLFLIASDRPDVYIANDAPTDGAGAWASRCDGQVEVACTAFGKDGWRIFYPSPSTIDIDMWVLAHELGHVLGLAHDDGLSMSPMKPNAGDGGKMMLVTHADSVALHRRYCSPHGTK